MNSTIVFILGGGRGTRLFPLTKFRSKPAVSLAGKYRLIDVPISNCINSGLDQIYVLTQFNSASLHRHIRRAYPYDRIRNGFVELLAAQQTMEPGSDWYEGTADAVRKNLRYIEQPGVTHVLVLCGDQLYRMDYRRMLETHGRSGAQVTIAGVPVPESRTPDLGILKCDDDGRLEAFVEKPKTQEALAPVRSPSNWLRANNVEANGRDYIANMGVYLFNRDALVRQLNRSEVTDFGKEILPEMLKTMHLQAHLFDGYWEDVGTIRAYYDANLALARSDTPFPLISAEAPLYTEARFLPPSRFEWVTIRDSIVIDGCEVGEATEIDSSVIGLRTLIGKNVTIRHSVVLGSDDFQPEDDIVDDRATGTPPIGIGSGSFIEGAIVDKNCRIGKKVEIRPIDSMPSDADLPDVYIRDGIIVVPKGAILPDGWTFASQLTQAMRPVA